MKPSTFERILLATDGSEPAQAAVEVARALARVSGASVLVVHVWNMEVHRQQRVWNVETLPDARRLISNSINRMRRFMVKAKGEIVIADFDHVAVAIAQVAQRFKADLLVVGSRGLSDWQSILLTRSVSHELLTKVDCPVLVVRGPSSASSHRSQRVLLAVAGGNDLEPAVRAAIAATPAPGSEVLVLHVAQALLGAQGFAYVEPEEEIQRTMRLATDMLKEAGVAVSTSVARHGPVVQTIVETAHRWKADIIVIGSARMGDVASLVFGSVAHGLLHTSEVPVLIAERTAR